MSEKMTAEAATALRKPFPPESVGKLPKPLRAQDNDKGKCEVGSKYSADGHACGGWHARSLHLDFVGHAATTDRLLTVDPLWTWEPVGVDPATGLPMLDRDGNLWIRLTVLGVTRYGVGDGKSMKERIGDAIRNAAMRFGVALDLWAKEDLVEFAQAASARKSASLTDRAHATPEPEPDPETGEIPVEDKPAITARTRGRMFALLSECGIEDEADQKARMSKVLGREVESRSSLTEAEAKAVIAKLSELRDWQREHGGRAS